MSEFESWWNEHDISPRMYPKDLAESAYLAAQASAEQQITELKYLLSRVLEASVPYYDDGTPIINDELSDRLNKVLP